MRLITWHERSVASNREQLLHIRATICKMERDAVRLDFASFVLLIL